MDVAAIIGAILALVGTAVSVGVSSLNKAEEVETSKELNAQNIAFTKEENAINREREDNYLQRRVADATRAGLSPLSVADNQPASATVSVPQNTYMPNIGQYGIGMANAFESGFSEAGRKVFESGQTERRLQSAEKQLADTLANSNDIAEKQEVTKRFVAQLGADTETANTIAKIVSAEKLNGYDNASRVAGGLPWLLSEQGQSTIISDSKSGKRTVSYGTVNGYKRDYDGFLARGLRKKGYTMGYFIQARCYFDDPTVNLQERINTYIAFMKGKHPSIPYQYVFRD